MSSTIAYQRPYFNAIAEGFVTDQTAINMVGYDGTVGATWETLWELSTPYVYIASGGEKVTVKSNSAQDGVGGTGARTLLITGLDANFDLVSETITTNGVALVSSANTYERILSARVATIGTNESNVGNITIRDTSDTTTVAYIVVGEGSSRIPVFTVPRLYRASIVGWSYGDVADKASHIALWARPFGGSWYIANYKIIKNQASSESFEMPFVFEEKTDLELMAFSIGGGGAVQASLEGYYRK